MFWRAILPLLALVCALNAKNLGVTQSNADTRQEIVGSEDGWIEQMAMLFSGVVLNRGEVNIEPVSKKLEYGAHDLVEIAKLTLSQIKVSNSIKGSEKAFLQILLLDKDGSSIDSGKHLSLRRLVSGHLEDISFSLKSDFARLRLEVFDEDFHSASSSLLLGGEITIDKLLNKTELKIPEQETEKTLDITWKCNLSNGKSSNDFEFMLQQEVHQKATQLWKELHALKQGAWKLVDFLSKNRDFPITFKTYEEQFNLTGLQFPGFAQIAPVSKQLKPETFGKGLHRLMQGLYSFAGATSKKSHNDTRLLEFWESFFTDLEMPKNVEILINHWKEDYYFARQFLQSVNPFQIKFVKAEYEVPEAMRSLTTPEGDDVATLIKNRRLLIADYHELASIPGRQPEPEGHYSHCDLKGKVQLAPNKTFIFYAPYVLFYAGDKEEAAKVGKHNLNVLGIQLTRHENKNENKVYTPKSKPNTWLYAKIIVQNADIQVDAMVHHLALCHLALEPFAVAHHNWMLKRKTKREGCSNYKDHILTILEPHVDNVIGINSLARQTLLQAKLTGPIIQDVFSVGVVPDGLLMMQNTFKEYDYAKFHYKREMARRGFGTIDTDSVTGYFYRDDGDRLWKGLEKYVSIAVNDYYQMDAEVENDQELQTFFKNVTYDGQFNGLKDPETGTLIEIKTKAVLTDVLTAIIFHASAFHAIENSAMDSKSFVPNKPESLLKPMPDQEKDLSMDYIVESLPNFYNIMFQSLASYVLSAKTTEPLSQIKPMELHVPEAHSALKDYLHAMQRDIEARDNFLRKNGQITYPFFKPDECNASIDI